MKKTVNLAIAGFRHGHIYSLFELASQSCDVTIVGGWEEYEPDKESAEKRGVVFTYDTYEDLLADPNVDAVAIGNYYSARGNMVIAALQAGKHVIVDKPICISLEELQQIKSLQKESKLQVFAMLDLRFHPAVQAAKELIERGEIGDVNNVYFGGQHPLMLGSRASWYFEEGKHGGTINDIAVHGVDLIRYLTGFGVAEVNGARTWNRFAKGIPHFKDSAMFLATLENGAGVIADVSYAIPDSIGFAFPMYWEFKFWGTKGMINFSYQSETVKLYQNGNTDVVEYTGKAPEENYMDCFVCAVRGEDPVHLSTEESLRSSEETLKIQAYANA